MNRWTLERMQLVNWGGYDGHHVVDFDDDMTLLTGGSGTGKSTLLDAYTALIADSTTPLNGASNDLATGRPRGDGQRNVLNYIRGRYDTLEDESGNQELLLREGEAWGAVAATFRADEAEAGLFAGAPRRFTAMRVYYAGEEARSDGALTKRRFTIESAFDLSQLEQHVDHRFQPAKVRAAHENLRGYDTYHSFVSALTEHLGIGQFGNGAAAINLLARVQAGGRITSVAGLYQQYVLEGPATFARAQDAVRIFDDYQASRRSYQTALAQGQTLEPIRGAFAEHEKAASDIAASDILRPDDDSGPFAHWRAGQIARRAEIATNAAEQVLQAALRARDARRAEAEAAKTAFERAEQLVHDAGGGKLEELERAARRAAEDVQRAERALSEFRRYAPRASERISDETSFEHEQQEARRLLAAGDGAQREAAAKLLAAHQEHAAARTAHQRLQNERQSLQGRRSNLPSGLVAMRDRMAEAAGLTPADVPFIAELVDIAPGEERWRRAADAVLGGMAQGLLVDARRYDQFRDAIEQLPLQRRIRFRGVEVGAAGAPAAKPGTLASKLVLADTPFRGWLGQHLEREANHICVEDARQLVDDGDKRVTPAGQERHGKKGAHGGGHDRIIGFDNRARIAELEQQEGEAARHCDDTEQAVADASREHDDLKARALEARHLDGAQWAPIDVAAAQAELGLVEEQIARLRDGDSDLSRAVTARNDASAQYETARDRAAVASDEAEKKQQAYEQAMSKENRTAGALAAFDGELDTATADRLDSDLADEGLDEDETDQARIDVALANVAKRARALRHQGEQALQIATERYGAAVRRFQDNWPAPSLGTGWLSYPEYLEILERHEADRSAESLRKWDEDTVAGVAQHLSALHAAFSSSMHDVRRRLFAVNELLAGAPFGASRGTLRMVEQEAVPSDVAQLKSRVRKLAGHFLQPVEPDRLDEAYRDMASLIEALRADLASERRPMLDVRKHLKISAGVFVDGKREASYTGLGERSGGETQELVAFILGAALRYQLGDGAGQPRFSTVILDEAFIKADSEFTQRSVGAWRTLGFQLIVGAPFDKSSTLEPFAGLVLETVKSADHFIHVVDVRKEQDAAA